MIAANFAYAAAAERSPKQELCWTGQDCRTVSGRDLSGDRSRIGLEELTNHLADGTELAALERELAQVRGVDTGELTEEEDVAAPHSPA